MRAGHWRSVELLENTRGVRETLTLYECATGHPVYLRPTDAGLTVISLDPSTSAMVGVGAVGDCVLTALPASPDFVEDAARAWRAKVASMARDSAEERFVIGRVRAALGNGLDLGDNVAFLHQEWRLSSSDKVDLLGVDRRTGQLVVFEAKRSEAAALRERDARGRTAAEQGASYVAQLTTHAAEWAPLFQRLATALARIYGRAAPGWEGDGRRIDVALVPRWEVWWHGGSAKQPSAAIEESG